jgi:calmodulin
VLCCKLCVYYVFAGTGTIGIQDFMSIMVNKTKEDAFASKLVNAFRVFDIKGKGYLDAEVVRHIFASMEEEMPDEEIDELLREANIDEDNKIKYEGCAVKELISILIM